MLDSKALTKIQSIILITIIAVAALGGGVAYILLIPGEEQSSEIIKIGVCADIDALHGKSAYQGVVLATEQINNEGGILGKKIEVIAEDSDGNSLAQDITKGANALTKLLTFHKVDYVLSSDGNYHLAYQDIVAEHKKILLGFGSISNEITQRIEDDYQKYKYFFRTSPNATHAIFGSADCINALREYSGFNKVALLFEAIPTIADFMPVLANFLGDVHGFEIVYQSTFPTGTFDFSSYLTAIRSSGAEILCPWIVSYDGVVLVKDWFEGQFPFVLWGLNSFLADPDGWEVTEGRCEYTTNTGFPTVTGYPLTSETIPFRDAYIERWKEVPNTMASYAYDTLRFILFDALERAGTTETEAVIAALEEIEVETSLTRNFVFTPSHDVLGGENINNPDEDLMVVMLFQWQNEQQLPMYPKKIKEETGASYMFPDWSGPWDDLD